MSGPGCERAVSSPLRAASSSVGQLPTAGTPARDTPACGGQTAATTRLAPNAWRSSASPAWSTSPISTAPSSPAASLATAASRSAASRSAVTSRTVPVNTRPWRSQSGTARTVVAHHTTRPSACLIGQVYWPASVASASWTTASNTRRSSGSRTGSGSHGYGGR